MFKNILLTITLMVFIISCGGSKQTTTPQANIGGGVEVPDWYLNVPQNENILYSPSSASSKDMQLSINKASTDARAELGRILEARINALQKKFDEETGLGNDAQLLSSFTQATKIVVSTTLQGSKITKQKIEKEGASFRAYVLVELPLGAAKSALLDNIKKNEQLYAKFRASEAFKELDAETEKYEKFKKEQGQ